MSDDPFELLKKKLEAKKKALKSAGAQPSPFGKPKGAPPKRTAPRKGSGSQAGARQGSAAAKGGARGAGPAPSGKPDRPRIIRSAWHSSDVEKMNQSTETVGEDPPKAFTSHRFDSELDKKAGGYDKKKFAKEPLRRPKGFKNDRADRG